jgi:hypothetical protein
MLTLEKQVKSKFKTNFKVKLPKGESKDEWLGKERKNILTLLFSAVHVVDFINGINILYGSVLEHCTNTSCPKMIATEEFVFFLFFLKLFSRNTCG